MKFFWNDDGDGRSYTLWDSKTNYDAGNSLMLGQIDLLIHPGTWKRKWRATTFTEDGGLIQDWFTDKEVAMAFVVREYSHSRKKAGNG